MRPCPLGQLIYCITFLKFCQGVFQTFFEIFLTFLRDTCPFKRICPPFQRRSVFLRLCYYITIFALCQQIFQNFFISVDFIYCAGVFRSLQGHFAQNPAYYSTKRQISLTAALYYATMISVLLNKGRAEQWKKKTSLAQCR